GGNSWTVAPIPGFNSTDPAGSAFQRYSDPWVSIAPNGTVYVSALALSLSGGFPSTSAILVSTSTNGGSTWSAPATLINTPVPPGTNPIDLLNDKESITADPNDPSGQTAYVVWDRLNQPSDSENFNAFHGFAFRGDALFAKTIDGGAHWSTNVVFAPQANQQSIGHQLVVLPDANHTLVDSFTLMNGSGNQPAKAGQNSLAILRSTDHGATWSDPIIGPTIQTLEVSDPDTGAPVRAGETLADFAADPSNGNLYLVWCDGRFSKFKHNDIAFSMSTNGGLTWTDPIKVNQARTDIPDGNQQAFLPSVAVAANHTVAVTYYDFRNHTAAAGLTTDYWLVHADPGSDPVTNLTNPANWGGDEKRLTSEADGVTGKPFNLENAAFTSRGYFLGDYEGLAAAGNSFYALFAQAGTGSSDPSNMFFRDPPPAATEAASSSPAAPASPSGPAADSTPALDQAVAALTPAPAGPAASPALSAPAAVSTSSDSSAASTAAPTNLAALPTASAITARARDRLFAGWGENGPGDVLGENPAAA
ncbi:MAG TPA: sialidase family protein, partial [Gemmataceae bacterium]|nr:sialidase family protein [Gemmataceae bacterium]